jgi:hypothetical protein
MKAPRLRRCGIASSTTIRRGRRKMAGPTGTGMLTPATRSSARNSQGHPCAGGPGRRGASWSGSTSSPNQGSYAPPTGAIANSRVFGLRFYLGVRITGIIDETRDADGGPERVWGWSYQTLEGHLEQGRLSYEVIKNLGTGRVTFRVSGYSRAAPIPSLVIRWGFRLFGRWTQRRFYLAIQRRMRSLVQAAQRGAALPVPTIRADGVVLAPSGTVAAHPLERLARAWVHPGR